MRWKSTAMSMVVGTAVIGGALAQIRDDDWGRCTTHDGDASIAACTALIQSGKEAKESLADAFVSRGIAYDFNGEYDRAIQDFGEAIKLNPDDAENFYLRASAYRHKGENGPAIQDYDQAIKLNPYDDIAFISRGIAYMNKGEYDRGIQDFNQAIKLNADDADAFYNRGLAYAYKRQCDRAIEDFNRASKLDSTKTLTKYKQW
jgi:tetratricopeptide (TPR) repeat protein